jgi:hypothetical protein
MGEDSIVLCADRELALARGVTAVRIQQWLAVGGSHPPRRATAVLGGEQTFQQASLGRKDDFRRWQVGYQSPLRPRRLAQGPVALDHHRPGARTVAEG